VIEFELAVLSITARSLHADDRSSETVAEMRRL
jgi:hypothetical protein